MSKVGLSQLLGWTGFVWTVVVIAQKILGLDLAVADGTGGAVHLLLRGDSCSQVCVKSFKVLSTSRIWCALIGDILLGCFLGEVNGVVPLFSLRAIF